MTGRVTVSTNGKQKAKAESVQSEHRELTPIQIANEVVTQVRLKRIRFCSIEANASMAADAIPDDTRLQASTNFRRPTVDREEAGFKAVSAVVFKLTSRSPLASDQKKNAIPYVLAKATLEADYSFRDDAQEFTVEQLETFALHYFPFHMWGYWREFVHSTLARFEFPTLTVPLFEISMAQALVVDEID